ncbi:EscF/YscF/HrpA family type III secretion system needle major subunit [Yersinia massiliensis]|uniref:EscF/YscF/HrpA family type III secretion system needle major subunit n=1 Tax=Yersinia massiliensis TaxID=419257 RepID=UPI000688BB7D|nr:EscF/YscF/HrpA family type III secretion system needle major subunit [Yersinia massiliensis]
MPNTNNSSGTTPPPAVAASPSRWTVSSYEEFDNQKDSLGMAYRSGALLNARVNSLAKELKDALSDPNNEMDNPIVLAKISALNGHYNGVRQAQSNIMKSIKDTSQAIIRNM